MNYVAKPGVDYVGITTPFYCYDSSQRILLHRRSVNCRDEHGMWDPGSGKLEFGYTPEENVIREVKEEYCADGIITHSLPAHSIFRMFDNISTHWLAVPFFVRIDPAQVKIGEPDKIDEIGWFSLENLPSPLHSGFSYTLSKFFPEFVRTIGSCRTAIE